MPTGLILLVVFATACASAPPAIQPGTPAALPTATPTLQSNLATPALAELASTQGGCRLESVVVPTMPSKIPGATQLDETTGLHMTGIPQQIDIATYRLKVSGLVEHPLSLSYDDLRCLPKVTASATLECVGVFRDSGTWSGTPIAEVLAMAGVQRGASSLRMVGADGYMNTVSLEDALNRDNFLAYEMQGRPLPILHGFPLRTVFPHKVGNLWVKWLVELVVE